MKTFKKVRRQGLHNGVILPAPYQVRTPTGYGGHAITSHLSADEAQSRVIWLRWLGQDGEIVGVEQPADRAAWPSVDASLARQQSQGNGAEPAT